ncbi:DsrE/DsrF/DrsH-like family protein [Halobacteriaceae archaeon GCM10025711]
MSTDTPDATTDEPSVAELQAELEELRAEFQALPTADAADQQTKMTVIAVHGTLDMAYPTLILSSMAGAFDWDVTVFASFWALDMLHEEKSRNLKMSSAGNVHMPVPNLLAVMPGMDRMTTWMMNKRIDDMGTPSVRNLIERGLEHGVEFQACQMTMDLMGYEDDDMIDGVTTGVGAGKALFNMEESDIQLVI